MALWIRKGLTLHGAETTTRDITTSVTGSGSAWTATIYMGSVELAVFQGASEAAVTTAAGAWLTNLTERANDGGITIIIDTDDF